MESDSVLWLILLVPLLGVLVWVRVKKGRSSGNAMPPGLGGGSGGDPGGGFSG